MSGSAFSATVILQSGLNTISITATDTAGNLSSTAKRSVMYDSQKPAVSITSPSSDITTAHNSIAIEGQVVDSLTSSTAAITIDGVTKVLPLDSAGAFSTTAVLTSEGPHTIMVMATNQAGAGTSVQRNVQYTLFGDLNGSGSVDLSDAVIAFQHISGAQLITNDVVRKRCDVAPLGTDGKPRPDGTIDLGDVVIIMRKIVGLVNW
jgi:hypothetical protein